jgi:hypothetical protein
MLKTVIIPVNTITKIKKFPNSTVFYTDNSYWVCIETQSMPVPGDTFITLSLKGKSDNQ